METPSIFTPRRLGRAEFLRSNVFTSWSLRLGRVVEIVGPTLYDAWLIVEFDPTIVEYCERPPMSVDLSGQAGRKRAIDFWVKEADGKQHGIIVFDPRLGRDRNVSLQTIQSSLERAGLHCKIWSQSDLRGKSTLIENLKFLRPFTATEMPRDLELESGLIADVGSFGSVSWGMLVERWSTHPPSAVNFSIARLMHAGRLIADLSGDLITNATPLALP